MKNIIHIADIHIRPLERHDEYIQVFSNFYNYLETLEKDETILFICGDIFHTKDKLLSETIVLYYNFLEKISNLCDKVFIILGNHDLFKSNIRYDTAYGISYIGSLENVTYIRKSSNFIYKNLSITTSCINDKFQYYIESDTDILDTEPVVKIHLYHGIVHGVNDTFMGTVYKTPNDFKNFDLVLLGDIHEHKYIENDNSQVIAYPGSLIQQNFKESLNKGFIHYIYNNSTDKYIPKFITLKNEYCYYTILINEDGIQNKDELNILKNYKYAHIRLILELDPIKCTNDFLNKIIKQIEKNITILSITKQFKNIIEKINKDIIIDNNNSKNIALFENDILLDILNKLTNNDEEKILLVQKYHSEVKDIIEYKDIVYSNSWSIKSLEFQNVFIYGGNHINKINLENGLIGILGNNAIGKSCILYIIIYSLFGYISKSKNVSNKNIMNKNAKSYYIKLEIEMSNNNDIYIIERKSGKIRTRKTGNTTEEQLSFILNKTKDLTCSTKTDTEKLIKEILGITNKEDFVFTNIISSMLTKNIITMSNSELDDVLSNLFNTKIYKELYNYVKNENKTLLTKRIQLETELNTYKQANNTIEIDTNVSKSDLLKNYKQYQAELKQINKNIIIPKKIIELQKGESFDSLISIYKNKLEQYHKHIDINIECTEYEMNKLKELLNTYDKKSFITEKPLDYNEDTDYSVEIENITQYLKHNSIQEDICYDNFISLKDINNLKSQLNKMKSKNDLSDKQFILIQSFFKNYIKNCQFNLNQYNSNISKILIDKLKQYTDCINYEKYQEYLNDMNLYNKYKQYFQYNSDKEYLNLLELNKEYNEYMIEKDTLKNKIQNVEVIISKLELIEKYKNTNNEKIKELNYTLDELNKKLEIVNIYKNLVSDKYLPKYLLEYTIKQIQQEANELIYTLCNITISFETIENCKWNIIIHKNNMELSVHQCSGYETFIINVALKIIFDKYKFYSGIKMFFIDEGLDCVSEENYDKLDDLFELLKSYYNTVIIISHNETLKQKVEKTINISTDFINSKIIS